MQATSKTYSPIPSDGTPGGHPSGADVARDLGAASYQVQDLCFQLVDLLAARALSTAGTWPC